MKYKEIRMRLLALGMSVTLCLTPMPTFAIESEAEIQVEQVQENIAVNEVSSVANEDEFVIEDGVLLKYTGTEQNVVIPDGVTEIEDEAFSHCIALAEIVIPKSVTAIGDFALNNNSKRLTIFGYAGSYAQIYAAKKLIKFTELEAEDDKLPQENPFTDVPKNEYYYNPVLWALEHKITTGLNATTFGPEEVCTRGQVVTFLWRAMGEPEPKTTKHPFVDIDGNGYYYKAVLWALENNITTGYDSTHFAPDETVTRGQFVTFLHRAKNKPNYNTKNPFKDIQNGTYYYDAVLWAYEDGVTTGLNATKFGPDEYCTRGQVVTFLYRALNEE